MRIIGRNDDHDDDDDHDHDHGLPAGAIVGIVIGGLLVVVGGAYLVYRWNLKRKRDAVGKDMEQSLLDRDTINVPKND